MSQMMAVLAVASALSMSGAPMAGTAIDVSDVKVGAPTTITTLDLGKLKGDLRQVGWSPDGTELYVQTADGNPSSEKLRHYIVPVAGGAPKPVDAEPEWATDYWGFKSDRFAPGLRSILIDVEQKLEKTKIGTGSGRPGEMANAGGAAGANPVDIEKTAEGQHQNVARLKLFGETISEFVNQVPIPGLMFSWGPRGSGAIAYTDREVGRLMLLDQHKHKQTVTGIKDALLPAWSTDGTRLAWVQKDGRKKYALVWATVVIKG
jgi:hypothetical protein